MEKENLLKLNRYAKNLEVKYKKGLIAFSEAVEKYAEYKENINHIEIIKDALNLYIDIVTPYDFENDTKAYNERIGEVKELLKELEA